MHHAPTPLRVLVAGSTGYLGKHLIRVLHARGHEVRALVRNPQGLGDVRDLCHTVFEAQATDDATLAGVAHDVDAVISCLGSRSLKRKPTIWEVDRNANLNLVRRAEAAGVSRFVFVSVLRGDVYRTRVPQLEAREQVVDALAKSHMPWTIIRPSGFFNDMTEFLHMAQKGKVWLIGDPQVRFNPIHGADLAAFTVDKLEDTQAVGQSFPVGGPDIITQKEVAEMACRAWGKDPRYGCVPSWLVLRLAQLLSPFHVNVGSLLAMLASLAAAKDSAAPTCGTHHLDDFFKEQAKNASDDLRIHR